MSLPFRLTLLPLLALLLATLLLSIPPAVAQSPVSASLQSPPLLPKPKDTPSHIKARSAEWAEVLYQSYQATYERPALTFSDVLVHQAYSVPISLPRRLKALPVLLPYMFTFTSAFPAEPFDEDAARSTLIHAFRQHTQGVYRFVPAAQYPTDLPALPVLNVTLKLYEGDGELGTRLVISYQMGGQSGASDRSLPSFVRTTITVAQELDQIVDRYFTHLFLPDIKVLMAQAHLRVLAEQTGW